ncbi:MAG: hypothetical protein ACNS60_09355 [Candidatus Cyclobacteriaceae bacterium M2_1C_046]
MKFADLHCHPTGKLFAIWSLKNDGYLLHEENHPWRLDYIKNNAGRLAKGTRAVRYSQSDFGRGIHGRTKITFASLYPFEQGFFNRTSPPSTWITSLARALHTSYRLKFLAAHIATNTSIKRLSYIKGRHYDYFKELNREYDFIKKMSGRRSRNEHSLVAYWNRDEQKIEYLEKPGTYTIISNTKQSDGNKKYCPSNNIENCIEDLAEDEKLVVLTIEGINTLSMHNGFKHVSEKVLMDRIVEIKRWDPPIFFITLAHHFNNNLCAHAHSMPTLGKILGFLADPDQTKNMNKMEDGSGINQLGLRAIKKLLHINGAEDAEGNGKRILIDVKHMSALARQDFYEKIIKPYNQGKPEEDKIPVIASHVGYAGVKKLDDLIRNYDKEVNLSLSDDGNFNPWNINLCDDDVKEIVESRGLIGICFDQRVLGFVTNPLSNSKDKKTGIERIFLNIIGMANGLPDVQKKYHPDKFTVWNCFTIGTDHDGVIDPVDEFPTMSEFPDFYKQLIDRLKRFEFREDYGFHTEEDIKRVVEMICFGNAYTFLKKHFNKPVGVAIAG